MVHKIEDLPQVEQDDVTEEAPINGQCPFVHHVAESSLARVLSTESRLAAIQLLVRHKVVVQAVVDVPLQNLTRRTQYRDGVIVAFVTDGAVLV